MDWIRLEVFVYFSQKNKESATDNKCEKKNQNN